MKAKKVKGPRFIAPWYQKMSTKDLEKELITLREAYQYSHAPMKLVLNDLALQVCLILKLRGEKNRRALMN